MDNKVIIGSVVKSKMGRDKGNFFVVVEIVNDDFVMICDGNKRKIANPKLKKLKHLKPNGEILEKVQQIIFKNESLYDKIISDGLKKYNQQTN